MQGSGLGSSLILESLADAALVNASIFVLGDPAYYQRFGFEVVPEPRCPFDPSNEHFMALRYAGEDGFVIGYETDFG